MNTNIDVTGLLSNWCIHRLNLSDDDRAEMQQSLPGRIPCIVTGIVEHDRWGRFPKGNAMRSSTMLGFDLQNMCVYTSNSLYQLKGPGWIVDDVYPLDYGAVVGLTIVRNAALLGEEGP